MKVEGTKRGMMKRTFVKSFYGPELWKKRPVCFSQEVKSLLIMDSVKSYLKNVVEYFMGYNTECRINNGGITPLLQFTDTHVIKPFKHILKDRLDCKQN